MNTTINISNAMFSSIESGELKVVATKERYGYLVGEVMKVDIVDRKDQSRPIRINRKDIEDTYWIKKEAFDLVENVDEESVEIYSIMDANELATEFKTLNSQKTPCEEKIKELARSIGAVSLEIKGIRENISLKFGINKPSGSVENFEYNTVVEGVDIKLEMVDLINSGDAAIKLKNRKWDNPVGTILLANSLSDFDIGDKRDAVKIKDASDGVFEWIGSKDFVILIDDKTSPVVNVKDDAESLDSVYLQYSELVVKLNSLREENSSEQTKLSNLTSNLALVSRLGTEMFKVE